MILTNFVKKNLLDWHIIIKKICFSIIFTTYFYINVKLISDFRVIFYYIFNNFNSTFKA